VLLGQNITILYHFNLIYVSGRFTRLTTTPRKESRQRSRCGSPYKYLRWLI